MATYIDLLYQRIIAYTLENGARLKTRNHEAISCVATPVVTFQRTPLVTLRKTHWEKAIREWEWFMRGDVPCPDDLASSWWEGQLGIDRYYRGGYGAQLREFQGRHGAFDQINYLLAALKEHQNSRRLIMTTWNPADCAEITRLNDNAATPTPCHNTITQFYVRHNELHAFTFQRSADLLLGLPHNWIQFWAFLLWLAHEVSLLPGSVQWKVGDAHIYTEAEHMEAARRITETNLRELNVPPQLHYFPTETESSRFNAEFFRLEGKVPDPITLAKPKLLI